MALAVTHTLMAYITKIQCLELTVQLLQNSSGERKTAYLAVFGIAEHFKKMLISDVKGPFVILFDESMNKKIQQKQMDLQLRFWKAGEVVTRYLGSKLSRYGGSIHIGSFGSAEKWFRLIWMGLQ